MSKGKKIVVKDIEISILEKDSKDYICLTDMAKEKSDDSRAADVIKNWIRTRNAIEYLGAWEQLYNPNFKVVEFDHFRKSSGSNSFVLSPKEWCKVTKAIGIFTKSGRYGGTYADKDIAFHFGMWISPIFQLYVVKEYQRLKEIETNEYNLEWDVKRVLTKVNYKEHTDAVKEIIIPKSTFPKDKKWIEYAKEADLLNVALFGYTAKEWKELNPTHALKGKNPRDFASINELIVLSRLETINGILIRQKFDRNIRFNYLKKIASVQLKKLKKIDFVKSVKRLNNTTYLNKGNENDLSSFNKNLKAASDNNTNNNNDKSKKQ